MGEWRLDRVGEQFDETPERHAPAPEAPVVPPIPAPSAMPEDLESGTGIGDETPARGRARRGLWIVLAAAVGGGALGYGGWHLYDGLSPGGAGGEVPLIRADTEPVRIQPDQPGGMQVPHQDRLVLQDRDGASPPTVEGVRPPPEEPLSPLASDPAVVVELPPAQPGADDPADHAADDPADGAPPPPPADDAEAADADERTGDAAADRVAMPPLPPDGPEGTGDGEAGPPADGALRVPMPPQQGERLPLPGPATPPVTAAPAPDGIAPPPEPVLPPAAEPEPSGAPAADDPDAPAVEALIPRVRPEPAAEAEADGQGADTAGARQPDAAETDVAAVAPPPAPRVAEPAAPRPYAPAVLGLPRPPGADGGADGDRFLDLVSALAQAPEPAPPTPPQPDTVPLGNAPGDLLAGEPLGPPGAGTPPAVPVTPAPSVALAPVPGEPAADPAPPPPPATAAAPAAEPDAPPEPPPVRPVEPQPGGRHHVQIVAVQDEADIEPEWRRLRRLYPDLLGALEYRVERTGQGDAVWHRVMGGPLTAAEATRVCTEMRARGGDCIVRRR
jgi:hypothetical protein